MFRSKIKEALQKATGVDGVETTTPTVSSHGDYSTNIALKIHSSKNPKIAADEICQKLKKDEELSKIVSKIELAGPGFINFFLGKDALVSNLNSPLSLKQDKNQGKTVVIDYSSPNIAKRFSVGHLRSTIIGQALYSLYKSLGFEVIGDNHLGDWGTQFGMILAAVEKNSLDMDKLTVEDLENLYIEYAQAAKEDQSLHNEAKLWFKKLEEGDETARARWQKAVDISIAEFEKVWDKLDVKIDHAYGESFYEDKMSSVVELAEKKGILKDSDGAKIVEIDGLVPAILLKSDGTTTYLTRDLATIKYRKDNWNPNTIIYEVGAEQALHFKQVFAVARMLGIADGVDLVHVAHGLFLVDGKKMSTRKGTNVRLEEVLAQAVDKARALGSENDSVAEAVGIGAIKYYDLMHAPTSNINFSWDAIFNMEGNSGPYLQYTFARTNSVLSKAEFPISDFQFPNKHAVQLSNEELSLLRILIHFQEVLEDSAYSFAPNLLANYLFDLAQSFNAFYANYKIADNEFRLMLTRRVGEILQMGLSILGLQTPERM